MRGRVGESVAVAIFLGVDRLAEETITLRGSGEGCGERRSLRGCLRSDGVEGRREMVRQFGAENGGYGAEAAKQTEVAIVKAEV